jgi:hypothetical protein
VTTTPTAFPADPAGVVLLSVATWAVVLAPVFLRYRTRRTPEPAGCRRTRATRSRPGDRGAYDPGTFAISPERNLP